MLYIWVAIHLQSMSLILCQKFIKLLLKVHKFTVKEWQPSTCEYSGNKT